MCVEEIVEDKFFIPVVEEMLDELCGLCYCSKLYLWFGYHQLRHYKFLAMPFKLINAHFTFQWLINEVFRPFLWKIILVFLNDILVYNKIIKDHLEQLKAILGLLIQYKLYVKWSKYRFECKKVKYLSHIIYTERVKANPNKVKSIVKWFNNTKFIQGLFKVHKLP